MADNFFRDFLRDQMVKESNQDDKLEAELINSFAGVYVEERQDKVLDSKGSTILNVGRKHQVSVAENMDPAVQEALLDLIRKKPEK